MRRAGRVRRDGSVRAHQVGGHEPLVKDIQGLQNGDGEQQVSLGVARKDTFAEQGCRAVVLLGEPRDMVGGGNCRGEVIRSAQSGNGGAAERDASVVQLPGFEGQGTSVSSCRRPP